MTFPSIPTQSVSVPVTPRFAWTPFALGLAALVVLMFAPLKGGFFQNDDFILLAQAQQRWSMSHPVLFFTISQNGLFTPLNNLLFYLEFRAFGLYPVGYECFSVLLHWANSLLVAWVAWRLTRSAPAAWAAGIAFAVGFGKLEAVTWIAAFVHLVTTLCYLASVACFLRWLEGANRRFYGFALLFFVLGMFSKEPIVTLPLAIIAASLIYGAGQIQQRLRAVLPFFVLGAVYVLGMIVWQKAGPAASMMQKGIYKPGLSSLHNLGALGGAILPAPYDGMLRFLAHVRHLDRAYVVISELTAIAVVPLLVWGWARGGQAIRFGVLWVLIAFLPFVFVTVGIASRYLYLPSVGFSLILAGLVSQWSTSQIGPRLRILAVGVGVFAMVNIGLFAVWQHQQNANGAMRQALIQAIAALPARAPQTGTVCANGVSTKYRDLDLALSLWISKAPHFKIGNTCEDAPRPVAYYTYHNGRLAP